MADDTEELKALVVSFFQQTLKEYPQGFTLQEFERRFPDTTDEPADWYKRYNKKTTLEALEAIQDSINVRYDQRFQTTRVSLNLASNAVDTHLIDLITNQKSSNKKKTQRGFARPSHRLLASRSFSMNRQYSSGRPRTHYNLPARLNSGEHYKGDQFIRRRSPSPDKNRPPSIYDLPPTKWMASNDPRQNRNSSPSVMVPPQIRVSSQSATPRPFPSVASPVVTTSQPSAPTPTQVSSQQALSSSIQSLSSTGRPEIIQRTPAKEPEKIEEDSDELKAKKHHLRQRLLSLLMRKSSEIKIFHLSGLYTVEYNEDLNHAAYNHKSLVSLLQDPIVKESIQINNKNPFATISIRPKIVPSDKENISQSNQSNVTNGKPTLKEKLNSVDPFNVKPMLYSLEPLSEIKEAPLGNFDIDPIVKFKTFRMIFASEGQFLKLDEWESRFEVQFRLRIRIRDYGCRTVLEFFKRLSVDIPIKVELREEDQWVAVPDLDRLTIWLKDKMEKSEFRALTAIDQRYDCIAFPDDTYTYTDIKDILHTNYQPAHILSVKRADSMWIQLRTPKRIEDQLCIESSLMCYEDYHKSNLLPPPKHFIRAGFPCAVFDKNQERWCRGLVLKVEKKSEATTLLVDYGIERNYPITELICLMKAHLKLPVGSIYSKIKGVQTSISLQRRAKMILQEYTNPPVTLACRFLGSVAAPKNPSYLPSMVAEAMLVDTRQGEDCNLADDINRTCESSDTNEDGCEVPRVISEPTALFSCVIDQ